MVDGPFAPSAMTISHQPSAMTISHQPSAMTISHQPSAMTISHPTIKPWRGFIIHAS